MAQEPERGGVARPAHELLPVAVGHVHGRLYSRPGRQAHEVWWRNLDVVVVHVGVGVAVVVKYVVEVVVGAVL